MSNVTVVCTACGRPDLLEITLDSFFKFNTYDVAKVIVIEDSGIVGINDHLKTKYPVIRWIDNKKRMGQVKAIDRAYKEVKTEYIYHLEDDWQHYRPGFIEKSIKVLETDPMILQVWIRHLSDLNGHPSHSVPGTAFRKLAFGFRGKFHGFSWNPGLRRLSDYKRIAPFSQHTTFDRAHAGKSEIELGQLYFRLGYYAVVLKDGYVRHIGNNRHVL